MKYPILKTLAAVALLTGCIRPPDDGDGLPTGERFRLEFSPVRAVSLEDWGVRPLPASNGGTIPDDPLPPTNASVVRIEGFGTVEQAWANVWARPDFVAQRGSISLSYAIGIDIGCKSTAEQAQREGRSLIVEGFGTVAQAAYAQVCYPGPTTGGGSGGSEGGTTGGGTVGSNTGSAQGGGFYACPQPLPAEPQTGTSPDRPEYPGCWCQPPEPSFYVRAEKLASCSLGGKVIEPPTPLPPPLPVEPQPAPLPNAN